MKKKAEGRQAEPPGYQRKLNITKAAVDILKVENGQVLLNNVPHQVPAVFWDCNLKGFGVWIGTTGKKSYLVQKKIFGKSQKIKIGTHGVFTPDQARQEARRIIAEIETGRDPRDEKRTLRAGVEGKAGWTIHQALAHYLVGESNPEGNLKDLLKVGNAAGLKYRSAENYRWLIEVVLKSWADRRLSSITVDDVRQRFMEISRHSGMNAANSFRFLSTVYNRLINEDGVDLQNPVRLRKQWAEYVGKAKDVRIANAHLPAFFHALDDLGGMAADFFELLLLTGVRLNEALCMKWSWVHKDDHTIRLPGMPDGDFPGTKAKHVQLLPMSRQLGALIERRAENRTNDFVFPSARSESGHMVNFDKQLAEIIAGMKKITGDGSIHFSYHPIRRTTSSICKSTPGASHLRDLLMGWSPGDGKKSTADTHYTALEIEDLRKATQVLADEIYRLGDRPLTAVTSAKGKIRLLKGSMPTRVAQ